MFGDSPRPLFVLLVAATIAFPTFSCAQGFGDVFVRDLKLGSKGEDVRHLQQLLNRDPSTSLAAASGEAGSVAYETAYFGTLTYAAVVRFQNKYALEILAPIDLDQGTGFVGPRSRRVMNRLLASPQTSGLTPIAPPSVVTPSPSPFPDWQAPPSPVSPSPTPQVSPPMSPPVVLPRTGIEMNTLVDIYAGDAILGGIRARLDAEVAKFKATGVSPQIDAASLAADFKMYINSQSAFMGRVGSTLTFSGVGFDPVTNSVHFGKDYVLKNIPARGGSTIAVTVPEIPLGRYDVAVSNAAGVTNTGFFIVTGGTPVPVVVSEVTPASVRFGGEIVIHGSGFTATGNEVRTNVGTFKDLPSADGTSIRVQMSPELLRDAAELPAAQKQSFNMQVVVYVINSNGMSTNAKFFALTL